MNVITILYLRSIDRISNRRRVECAVDFHEYSKYEFQEYHRGDSRFIPRIIRGNKGPQRRPGLPRRAVRFGCSLAATGVAAARSAVWLQSSGDRGCCGAQCGLVAV
jgi:hypothetical protein